MNVLVLRRGLPLAAVIAVVMLAWAAGAGAAGASDDWNYLSNPPLAQVDSSSPGVPYCLSHSLGSLVCYAPSFIRKAYDVPSTLDGTGQTILIVDAYGSPTITSDLKAFDTTFGIPDPPSFTIACPSGCSNSSVNNTYHNVGGWATETSLDVEWAHAIAPGAKIVLVVSPSSSGNAINTAERLVLPSYPGSIMSQSFGFPEAAIKGGGNNGQVMQAHANYLTAKSEGITVLASAGDFGATNGGATANASYPASDPLVTGVGGTQGDPYVPFGSTPTGSSGLVTFTGTCTAATRPGWPSPCSPTGYGGEDVWNEGPPIGAATGGAPSLIFPAPSYQQGVNGSTQRTVADVGYNAAVNGGVLVLEGGTWFVVGGTSAGSPQWAGIIALANQARGLAAKPSLGCANPTIYNIAEGAHYSSDFHDITTGNNQLVGTPVGFPAGSGYDFPTGWGTPNVANLVTDLASS